MGNYLINHEVRAGKHFVLGVWMCVGVYIINVSLSLTVKGETV